MARTRNIFIIDADIPDFFITSVLTTRVTSTPTNVGEYRSRLRNASATTYTDTNGAPTATPSSVDGFRYYSGNPWAVADTNNNPSKYEIFVGKNKQVEIVYWNTTGRTGVVNTGISATGTVTDVGIVSHYDETTGIVTLISNNQTGTGRTTHFAGIGASGQGFVPDPYFDILVRAIK